jgi:dGTPase
MHNESKRPDLAQQARRLNRSEQQRLSPLASASSDGIRRRAEHHLLSGYRQAYSVDVDRVLNAKAYVRYIDKTQVFSLARNDHVTHRALHVQLLSKIARTIGRFLRLNEDLIEAIALGHDIGHPPFGHSGERFLSDLCRDHGIGRFCHAVQSVQFLDRVERGGRGWNLCLQTLDGILCHDGEAHDHRLAPRRGKGFTDLTQEMAAKRLRPETALKPMTLEGCAVRLADTVSYIGRDIEDAIRLGLIGRGDLPADCVARLGETNGTIVYRLVTDLIANSGDGCDRIGYSDAVAEALGRLKAFNYERIYTHHRVRQYMDTFRTAYGWLFETALKDLAKGGPGTTAVADYLEHMAPEYRETHNHAEIARDFISGMTDRFFLEQCPAKYRPQSP